MPVHDYSANSVRNVRQIRGVQHVHSEVAKKRMEQHAIGARLEVAERKVYVEHVTCSVFLLAGNETSRRLQKYLAAILTDSLERWVLELAVQVTNQDLAIVDMLRSSMQCDTAHV